VSIPDLLLTVAGIHDNFRENTRISRDRREEGILEEHDAEEPPHQKAVLNSQVEEVTRIARVFPRKTAASPIDELAFFGPPPENPPDVDEVHVSCVFTYDRDKAESLADMWAPIATVKVGGPAYDDHGGEFVPGRYVAPGYVMTSRGCPNRCWFCSTWKREGGIRELKITEGHNILDSNLLACSDEHVRKVFEMLGRQKHAAKFTGGLEAARLRWWHVSALWALKPRPKPIYCAYDTPDDLAPLQKAGEMFREADFTRSHLRCYVLIGHPKDTVVKAQARLVEAWRAGFLPMAMLWRDQSGKTDPEWDDFQRVWARPAITRAEIRKVLDAYL